MDTPTSELTFLILQFLDEEKHKETVHRLESESGCYFNMRYFEELVTQGKWDEMEKYLFGFTMIEDNQQSMKIFFEIRKHKYLEALDKRDHAKAVDILRKDLRFYAPFSEDLFKEMALLLTLDDFRENPKLSMYKKDTESERGVLFRDLEKLIKDNPLFRNKLEFPTIKTSRLRTLINHSLNWQHKLCKNPKPKPDMETLFVDHICNQPIAASPAISHPNIAAEVLSPHGPAPSATIPAAPGAPVRRRRSASLSAGSAIVMGPQTPSGHMENQTADSNNPLKRPRPCETSQEVGNILPVSYSGEPHTLSPDDLPKVVATTLPQGSPVTSMEFHPVQQILLLVGTIGGDVFLWDVGARKKISEKCFDIWKLDACSKELQESLNTDKTASVNHVAWSPDGTLFGVAYSKNIVHIYSFCRDNAVISHLEIEAHRGSVNHLAFSYPNEQLSVVTCGDDRLIKVWDAATGATRFTFEGHEAPVFSVCPHQKENIQFVFSAATDGKVRTWLYDELGARGTYDAPGHSLIRMAYSSDGTRLFSCGTNKEGESFLVEWDESEGSIQRTYDGLGQRAAGIVQFDTTKNRFLAAGAESTIKIWDMNNTNILTNIHADSGLPASPCVRFNREGILLAVSTSDNGVKILATDDGFRLLRTAENRSLAFKVPGGGGFGSSSANAGITMANQSTSFSATKKNEVRTLADGKPRTSNFSSEVSTSWKVTEITEPSQCYSLRLPDNVTVKKVSRLIYTNSGSGVLALASNAEHKLWKWRNSDLNLDGKATDNAAHPVLWKPKSGIMMINETSDKTPEEAIPCLALSNNDAYLVSASGGEISLFNMATFKCMATYMPPPPAATFLAFHPSENNIIGIGFEDSSIQIYNLRTSEVRAILNGHTKRITGLAFSLALNILVSSGADSQVCVWGMAGWEKRSSMYLKASKGRSMPAVSDTRVQFHQNEIHLLVVNETQIAIYDAQKLDCLKLWFRCEATIPITSGTYSGDSKSIFVGFEDGTVNVLTASNLRLRCRINPTAYLPSNPSSNVHPPLVIAAHPTESNQFAVGLSNGHVYVVEASESEGRWGTSPPGST
uniref:CTLH domain-containing protein n=1 Tax=Brassica campestris TaxID=3711 RepID=M4CP67_BRACM